MADVVRISPRQNLPALIARTLEIGPKQLCTVVSFLRGVLTRRAANAVKAGDEKAALGGTTSAIAPAAGGDIRQRMLSVAEGAEGPPSRGGGPRLGGFDFECS